MNQENKNPSSNDETIPLELNNFDPKPKYGLFKGMSHDTYHNKHTEISNSGLKLIADKSPAHYYYDRLDPDRPQREMTDALRFGQAFHIMILEPEQFEKEVIVWSGAPRNTKAGKEEYNEVLERLTGDMILLKQSEYDQAREMADRIMGLSVARDFLERDGDAEASLIWRHPDFEVDCKSRLDFVTEDGFIIDIKTARDADHHNFRKDAYNFKYYMQAHFYMKAYEVVYGEKAKGFCFIVSEKSAPYIPAVYYATEEELMLGEYDANKALEKYEQCLKSGSWLGYPDRFEPLGLPPWGMNRLENGDD